MAEEELEELLVRDNPSTANEILWTEDERHNLCESFLEEHQIKGAKFFNIHQLSFCFFISMFSIYISTYLCFSYVYVVRFLLSI